jgi:hypothetical protein
LSCRDELPACFPSGKRYKAGPPWRRVTGALPVTPAGAANFSAFDVSPVRGDRDAPFRSLSQGGSKNQNTAHRAGVNSVGCDFHSGARVKFVAALTAHD